MLLELGVRQTRTQTPWTCVARGPMTLLLESCFQVGGAAWSGALPMTALVALPASRNGKKTDESTKLSLPA